MRARYNILIVIAFVLLSAVAYGVTFEEDGCFTSNIVKPPANFQGQLGCQDNAYRTAYLSNRLHFMGELGDRIYGTLWTNTITAARQWQLPVNTGVLALTTDITSTIADGGYINSTDLATYQYINGTDLATYGYINDTDLATYQYINSTDLATYGYINDTDIAAYNFINNTDLATYGYLNDTDIQGYNYIDTTDIQLYNFINTTTIEVYNYITNLELAAFGYINSSDVEAYGYVNNTDLNTTVNTALSNFAGIPGDSKNLTVKTISNSAISITADMIQLYNATSGLREIVYNVNTQADMANSGAYGLDTGTEAADTWYYVYIVSNGTSVVPTLSINSNPAVINVPDNTYTQRAYISKARNDSSQDFILYEQEKKTVYFTERLDQLLVSSSLVASAWANTVDASAWIPSEAVEAIFTIGLTGGGKFGLGGSLSGVDAWLWRTPQSTGTEAWGTAATARENWYTFRVLHPSNGIYYYNISTANSELYARGYVLD